MNIPGPAQSDDRVELTFLFDPEAVRKPGEPPEDSARLVWMFLTLLRRREVEFASYAKEFRRGEKTFRRDIAKLRELGSKYQFDLTPRRRGRVGLARMVDVADARPKAEAAAADALRAVADALGEVLASDVLAHIDTSLAHYDPFIRIALPRLMAQSKVAHAYRELRNAWERSARVRFRYPAHDRGRLEERIVEPHLVTYYDGRYYLVAFDGRPRTNDWRQFALDRIVGPISFAGSFKRRAVPRSHDGNDAIGLFKSGATTDVTIELSPTIAEAVVARVWQRAQRVDVHGDGSASIVLHVFDPTEAVRWAFGFGAEARVVAPAAAAELAGKMARELAARYSAAGIPPVPHPNADRAVSARR